ncbi:multidrug ABC transporter ATP-binding protein [Bacillus thuringiensis]|nr:multidrug ABC transporter ATP-binding protein [Bacillus thuringiensis]
MGGGKGLYSIKVNNLQKEYRFHRKEPGFLGSIKSMINRKYEQKIAVNDLSFKLKQGDFAGFIGPNGAGKTTTLKILTGILTPSHGEVEIMGCVPWKRSLEHRRQISIMMGNRGQLIWDLPPLETFELNKELYSISSKDYKNRLEELSGLLEVEHLLKVQTRKLSLGERMKMEMIAALLHAPKVLFLDEPTIGLDLFAQKKIRGFLKEYNQRYNATILLTSHYLDDIQDLCEKLMILNKGNLVYNGLTADIMKDFDVNKYISVSFKEKISSSQIERLGAKVTLQEQNKMVLCVNKNEMKNVATILLNSFPIEDLTVENISIEGVIEKIYSKSNKQLIRG